MRQRALVAASSSQLAPPDGAGTSVSSGSASSPHRPPAGANASTDQGEEDSAKSHKDADVLTKVTVYMGIGWIATIGLPWLFGRAGLSVWHA